MPTLNADLNDAFGYLNIGVFTGVAAQLHIVVGGRNVLWEGDGMVDVQINLGGVSARAAGDPVL